MRLHVLDDPYYLLYYGPEPRPASYFALEAQDDHGTGIVLRFDSLSKIVSSGLRIGFVSGPAPIVDAMNMHVRTSYCASLHFSINKPVTI